MVAVFRDEEAGSSNLPPGQPGQVHGHRFGGVGIRSHIGATAANDYSPLRTFTNGGPANFRSDGLV